MSLCREARERGRDAGFSLIEIIVALGIISLLVVSLLPQLVVGIKATRTSQLVTQVKALMQGELEGMRNLPYRVAPDAGPYVDMLDRYYPNKVSAVTTAPVCSTGDIPRMPDTTDEVKWTGYVANAAATERCSYEPANGAFYRTVDLRTATDIGQVAVITNAQFIRIRPDTQAAEVVAPRRSTYDTTKAGEDSPPSPQLGVTLTVLYREAGDVRATTTFTQIAQEIASPERVRAAVDATALRIESTDDTGASLDVRAGVATLRASLTHASTASADLAALTYRRSSTHEVDDGGSVSAAAAEAYFAPPSVSVVPESAITDCDGLTCWGSSTLGPNPVAMTAEHATPWVGSYVAPLTASLNGPVGAVAGSPGLTFDNTPSQATTPRYVDGVLAPLVSVKNSGTGSAGCAPAGVGYAASSGFIETTARGESSIDSVKACAQAATGEVSLLPTLDNPEGLITITLTSAWARCDRGGSTSGYGYEALVTVDEATVGPWTVTSSGNTILPDPATVALGAGRSLADYISSWTAISPSEVTSTDVDGETTIAVPSVVSLVTQELRAGPEATTEGPTPVPSDVKVTVGDVRCSAEDRR